MPQALVATKMRPPRTRPELVARPRLREALESGGGRALTLVSAPAGFGKTTLLAEWLGERSGGGSVAWVSLEEADDDPARFLAYLVTALRAELGEGIGEGVLAALDVPQPPPVQTLLGTLINELADWGDEISLVLDDYHVIQSGKVHEAVAFLVERLPENARIVIAGRADPPLPLPRLRARGQISELRAADLRFTTEEATAFLNGAMGLSLSAEDVRSLEGVTEGWVAALQLAAISMRDRRDVSGFVEAFSGSNRHVIDFLADEVLEEQPDDVREFLLSTSVLGRMSATLCDSLTGRSDGQEMLEGLERGNLFVVALDEERMWYRYHHLFADFLRGRLGREKPGLAGELHLRASGWYEESGHLAEAIDHALAAPDHDRAARLIERGAKGAWSRGEGPTVLRWVEALPEGAKRRRPRLILEHAQALALLGKPKEAEPLLEEGERAAERAGEDRPFLLGYASAVRSYSARLLGDAPGAVVLARKALSLMPEHEFHLRNFAAVCLGDSLRATGELGAAGGALAEAAEIGRAGGHVFGTLTALMWLARIQTVRGRLREAGGTLRRSLQYLTEKGAERLPAAGGVYVGMGALLYERNDLDGAEHELKRGMELVELTREVSNLVWGYVNFSKAKLARGDADGAVEAAVEAGRLAHDAGADLEGAIAANWMVRLRLSRGETAEAEVLGRPRAVDGNLAPGPDVPDPAWLVDRLTSARLLHAQGRLDEALRLLGTLRESAEAAERTGNLIEILALQALALRAANAKQRAVRALGEALALAEPEGYVRTFIDEGRPMAELLIEVVEAGQRHGGTRPVSAGYLAKLLAAFPGEDEAPTAGGRLPERLSRRETEVLALMAAGETNGEIAGRLFVSTPTVKTHVNNLYRKLGVHGRTRAVARARDLGLI